jgi:hypothetical protein
MKFEKKVEGGNDARPHPAEARTPTAAVGAGRRRLLSRFDESLDHGRVPACVMIRPRSYRFVPAGTAWYRINFFLRTQNGAKSGVEDCGVRLLGYHPLGWAGKRRIASEKVGICRINIGDAPGEEKVRALTKQCLPRRGSESTHGWARRPTEPARRGCYPEIR